MTQHVFAATRKGLMEYHRRESCWDHAATHFIGEPVTNILSDDRDTALYAAVDLGHFGVKLHRSLDAGFNWVEA